MAMAGGELNNRSKARVGIPVGAAGPPTSTEFSGVADMSGAIAQSELGGAARRAAQAEVAIDKITAVGLQMHSHHGGVVDHFRVDRGGQVYAYQPNV
eukprot:jgi/Tetstr1/450223/TSEL_037261.t1